MSFKIVKILIEQILFQEVSLLATLNYTESTEYYMNLGCLKGSVGCEFSYLSVEKYDVSTLIFKEEEWLFVETTRV